jgi:hypothetical protein
VRRVLKVKLVSNIDHGFGTSTWQVSPLITARRPVNLGGRHAMPSVALVLDRPTNNQRYTKAELIGLRRTMLLFCRSFPPGQERNQHWQIAQSLRRLFRNKVWMDTYTSER